MNRDLYLLVIDPQNDFCDLPPAYRPLLPDGERAAPALPVTGAHADMERVAGLIERGGRGLAGIGITLDSHNRVDVAHPTFWMGGDGSAVAPFTEIAAADVRAGRYLPRLASALPRVLAYLDTLETAGRYRLMVWPVHCEIGTWGQNVHADVRAAYNRWEESTLGVVDKIVKGTNPWTEHYSAVMAEVVDADDPATGLNRPFIERLLRADQVFIAGEAGSHCVKATTEHIAEQFGADGMGRLVLLTDCMSPVAGFEAQYDGFVRDMLARGAQVATSADVLPLLVANAAR
jgi:nicotinamidase-related amidase